MIKLWNQFARRQLILGNPRNLLYETCRGDRKFLSLQCSLLNEKKETDKVQIVTELVKRIRAYEEIDLQAAHLDWTYLLDKENFEKISQNIKNRASHADINTFVIL
jgi:hypothetical protein